MYATNRSSTINLCYWTVDRWRSTVSRTNTTSFLAVSNQRVSSMLETYIALWRGDWGMINQIYIVVYTFVLYPMMLYLAYTMIKGLIKQSKSGKNKSKFN